MTIGRECSAPRWGGVAQGSNSESPTKPQELSDCDFRPVQDHAGLTGNATGTSERIDTRLTQPAAAMFAGCSGYYFNAENVRLRLEVAAYQLPRLLECELDPDEREAIDPTMRGYVKRDMEAAR